MRKQFFILTILLGLFMTSVQANESDDFQGFKIQVDETRYHEKKEIYIKGSFSIFVNCGSQYAVWYQFPQSIRYKIKDKKTGITYESMNMEMSISWNGNQVYDQYSQEPCNQIITESFEQNIQELSFNDIPESMTDFMIQAEYINLTSDWIAVDNKPITFRKF